jgi:TrmH family RNA methyltransferase
LTRAQSARIRELLRDKRARNAEGAFIIEGAKPVYDALLHHPASVQSVVVAVGYERQESHRQRVLRESRSISSFHCPIRTFSTLSTLESPQGILAVVRQPRWKEDILLGQPRLFGLYGEQLQDPTNVGTIIRTATALNIDALWLTPESADIYNPKVVRASAGAVLSLPIFVAGDVIRLTRMGISVFAAEVRGRKVVDMHTIRTIPKRMILAVGNESHGLSALTIEHAACRFTIPLSRHVESLNVAATAAIALHYLQQIGEEGREHPPLFSRG